MLGVAGALAGCCANNVCDCDDARADAFYFKFDTGPGGFVPETELDTVVLKRYTLQLDDKGLPARIKTHLPTYTAYADSLDNAGTFDQVNVVRYIPTTATPLRPRVSTDTVLINNNAPFTQAGPRKLSTYLYRIEVRRAPGQLLHNDPRRYELNKITLAGEFYGTGCCTCYRNVSKTGILTNLGKANSDTPYTVTETDQVVPIPITK
ncbi:hypothetical protein BEN49_08765 [Hymenobacter coccineus]|uniref:Uncharacterized protein n=1 Tax=Hymenobacter coccineus TaxID=1908235 RepID=A0A1G1TFN6_9BACT|nr:hypothetical protein BEN49_08765 [Hymenobacter coccineus]